VSKFKGDQDQVSGVLADRRKALKLASISLAGAPLLVACGSSESTSSGSPTALTDPTTGSSDEPIARTTDIPEGSAKILPEHKLVITNDPPGTFEGFSYLCTHMGCPVTTISDEEIHCNCHGSVFSTKDGSVDRGPATKPLEQVNLRIEGSNIFRA
jgi:Rieske Fe-S protein